MNSKKGNSKDIKVVLLGDSGILIRIKIQVLAKVVYFYDL